MTPAVPSRPRLALAFTVIADGDAVHLIAGEDVRYSLRAKGFAQRLAELLSRCQGVCPASVLVAELPEADRAAANEILQRMAGERILVDGPVEAAAVAGAYRPTAEGRGPLVGRLRSDSTTGRPVAVFCQDNLNHHATLEFNRRAIHSGNPWMWVTTGPASRGFVSPVFLPDAGPCLGCLVRHFQRLSPAPQLFEALERHGREGGQFAASDFPEPALSILAQLVHWKIDQLGRPLPPSAVFRLHVLELATMEVTAHRVLHDPTCAECADARLAR
jgi:bacteriocin biosynthesis cyclodehydratase domain-containing protein